MVIRAIRRLHKDQRGFTLIEVLVVMTILGILAAIVSISLLGVTSNARDKAKNAEQKTVQAAFDAMLSDQQVPPADLLAACAATTATKDMSTFPATGQKYVGPDSTHVTWLANHYLRDATTQYKYSCDKDGLITQSGP